MYTITSGETIRNEDGKKLFLVTLIADTEADIPTESHPEGRPDVEWAPGSMCMIADGHQCKILNHNGEWV